MHLSDMRQTLLRLSSFWNCLLCFVLTEGSLNTRTSSLDDMVCAPKEEETNTGRWRFSLKEAANSIATYPTPATREGILRLLAKPMHPPTMQRLPMTKAGFADFLNGKFRNMI
ncbi:hypothetical protein QCA50_011009 [Cerrena zonata]|uniref:Uncharacterized protein n=1 Tax=Cerrena zonata TaxID=2478898 RepID=A0AAW0FWU1_9APHY